MTQVNIEKVIIKSFRNITDKEFVFDTNYRGVALCGRNHIGKTNVLNAIMFCLCGVDLNGSKDIKNNVPKNKEFQNEDIVIDIEVQLNEGKVRRQIKKIGSSYTTNIYINDNVVGTKNAEAQIDKMLGLLELAIKYDTTNVKVRKLLLNPLSIEKLKPIEFRTFIMQFIKNKVSYEECFKELTEIERKKILEIKNSIDPVVISSEIKSRKDSYTRDIKNNIIVIDYLTKNHPEFEKEIANLKNTNSQLEEMLGNIEMCEVANNNYALNVKKHYNEVCKNYFDGVEFALLEKNALNDGWSECCTPFIRPNVPFELGSTSEKITVAIKIVNAIFVASRVPMLIDEWETIDNKTSFTISNETQNQIIAAKVSATNNDEIIVKGI